MLNGKQVYLREIRKDDMKGLYKATHDKEILYMTGTRHSPSMEQTYQYFEKIQQDDTRIDLAICATENDELLGDLTIIDIDKHNNKAGFRIALHDKKYFGKGYGTEAVEIAIRYAFKELQLNRLQLEVYSHNPRGYRAYEKAGFKQEGVIRQSLYYNNQYSDEIIMGILKEDYERK